MDTDMKKKIRKYPAANAAGYFMLQCMKRMQIMIISIYRIVHETILSCDTGHLILLIGLLKLEGKRYHVTGYQQWPDAFDPVEGIILV